MLRAASAVPIAMTIAYAGMRILMAARANDKQAIDGPYLAIKDLDGYRRVAGRSAALGFDGVTILMEGHAGDGLRRLPVTLLSPPETILDILDRWGIHT